MMKGLIAICRWLVYSNFFIALCATAMCWQSAHLFQLMQPSALIPFVFFATLCSYSFHWYLGIDTGSGGSRWRWLQQYRHIHMTLLVVAIAGIIYFGAELLAWWPWLLSSAFVTVLYSAPKLPLPVFRQLRKVAYGKTVFLALVWTYVTAVLPFIMSGEGWRPAFTLFVAGRFFLIYAICILFDYRDREYDRSTGIRSLITWLDRAQIVRLFAMAIALYFIATISLHRFRFSTTSILLLLLPGILAALSYAPATRKPSDMLYYAYLDGLMALSAFLMLLPPFYDL